MLFSTSGMELGFVLCRPTFSWGLSRTFKGTIPAYLYHATPVKFRIFSAYLKFDVLKNFGNGCGILLLLLRLFTQHRRTTKTSPRPAFPVSLPYGTPEFSQYDPPP